MSRFIQLSPDGAVALRIDFLARNCCLFDIDGVLLNDCYDVSTVNVQTQP